MQNAEATELLRLGVKAAKAGDKPTARGHLKRARELDPKNEVTYLWLATVAANATEARQALEAALELNPRNARARTWLASLDQRQASRKAAQASCFVCNVGKPGSDKTCPHCGSLLDLRRVGAMLQNHDSNRDFLQRAAARLEATNGHSSVHTYRQLAIVLLNLHRLTDAIPALEKALELRPADDEVRQALEQLQALQAERARAVAESNKKPVCPQEAANGFRVLVVDDSPTVRKIVSMTLERQGLLVNAAADGFEALSKLGQFKPELILMDITMPNMDGYRLCKLVRENPASRTTPVVMLSSKDGIFDKARGKLAGCDDYLTKPFKPKELLAVIEKHKSERREAAEPRIAQTA